MDVLQKIIDLIDSAIDDNADNVLTNGNIIASWYKSDVDMSGTLIFGHS